MLHACDRLCPVELIPLCEMCIRDSLSDDMSVPAFLDNVLAHHLETYSEELGELFRRKTPKTF